MEVVLVRVGEELVIEEDIRITIVAIEGEIVHFAVSGPELLDVECPGEE